MHLSIALTYHTENFSVQLHTTFVHMYTHIYISLTAVKSASRRRTRKKSNQLKIITEIYCTDIIKSNHLQTAFIVATSRRFYSATALCVKKYHIILENSFSTITVYTTYVIQIHFYHQNALHTPDI